MCLVCLVYLLIYFYFAVQMLYFLIIQHGIGFVFSRYNIERPHESVFDVDLDLAVCWNGRCTDPIVILQDTMFSASQCGQEGSSIRRKRRSVDDLYVQSVFVMAVARTDYKFRTAFNFTRIDQLPPSSLTTALTNAHTVLIKCSTTVTTSIIGNVAMLESLTYE